LIITPIFFQVKLGLQLIKKITQERWKEQNLAILIDRGGGGREIRDQVPPLVGKIATKSLQRT